MPQITFTFDERRIEAKLAGLALTVEQAIEKALKPIASAMVDEARNIALAHIRYEGKKPGQYVASIRGGTFRKNGMVGGYVRSGDPIAHLLELGTKERFWKKAPSVAGVLRSTGIMPKFPAITPALAHMEGEIRSAVEGALKNVT